MQLNRRKPSPEDYYNFLLYYGSQKLYEATFIQRFLAHALHSDQLDPCLSPGDERHKHIHQYLKSVLDNVDKLYRKTIYNTQSRIVKFMANNDQKTTPLWDCEQFDSQVFIDFSPSNTFSVVGMMNQSWHKAFLPPSMAQFTQDEFTVGLNISPFEEIDDVTKRTNLFTSHGTTHAALHNETLRPPRTKRLKHNGLPDVTIDNNLGFSYNEWSHGLGIYGFDNRSAGTQVRKRGLPLDSSHNNQVATLSGANIDTDVSLPSLEHSTIADFDEPFEDYIVGEHDDNDIAIGLVEDSGLSVEEPTRSEIPEQNHSPNTSLHPCISAPVERVSRVAGGKNWMTRLLEDHKQRLAKKPLDLQQSLHISLGLDTCVEQAITQTNLNPFGSDSQVTPNLEASLCLPVQGNSSPGESRCVSLKDEDQDQSAHDHGLQDSVDATPPETSSGWPCNASGRKSPRRSSSTARPKKRRKIMKQRPKAPNPDMRLVSDHVSAPVSPPSVTNKSENYSQIPPDAYFEKKAEDEQPAWRCGISHCMGAYYNAGNRKNCIGCFTSVKLDANPKRVIMNFYLPSRSFWFHAAPHHPWKVSKPSSKPRSTLHMSHNSIAKDAYWIAIDKGMTREEAWQKGIEAVEAHLRAVAKKKEKKTPVLEPAPVPVDPGPHPSGSLVMEHGQVLPVGASFERLSQEQQEERAWRCDVNHVLGRYYMAGDIKSCPGCGSCKTGPGKHPELDFFLPAGTVARQKAPDLVKWKPRRAYKLAKKSKKEKQCVSHNQIASKKYWELVEQGHEHVEGFYDAKTLELAIEATEQHIDAKLEAARARLERESSSEEEVSGHENRSKAGNNERPASGGQDTLPQRDERGACLLSLRASHPSNLRERYNEGLDGIEFDSFIECEPEIGTEEPKTDPESSDDESRSSSDSE